MANTTLLAPPTVSAPIALNATKGQGWGNLLAIIVIFILVLFFANQLASHAGVRGATPTPDHAQAVYIDPRQMAADPQSFVGRNVVVQGLANNVQQFDDHTWIDMEAGATGYRGSIALSVKVYPKDTRILTGECYRIYGVEDGTQEMTVILTGASRTVPDIRGYAYSPAPTDQYGFCLPP